MKSFSKQSIARTFLGLFSLCGICTTASAQFTSGSGTTDSPYIISTADELNAMRDNLNACYMLGNDIDLSDWINTNSPTIGWSPIGTIEVPFTGNLNGDGHFITGIWAETTEKNVGLFGAISGEITIQKLGITVNPDKKIKGNENAGILVGAVTNNNQSSHLVTLDQIYVSGAVEASAICAGGIVGSNTAMHITMSNCYAAGSVVATGGKVGGLLGNSYGSINIIFDKCYTLNLIRFDDDAGGGIIGAASASNDALQITISNCAVINKSITAGSKSVSRLCGWIKNEKISFINNIAFQGIKINGEIVSSTTGDSRHGADRTGEELLDASTYAEWNFETIWKMTNDEFQLPILKNLASDKQPTEPVNLSISTGNPYEDLVDKKGSLNIVTQCGAQAGTDITEILQLAINACSPKQATVVIPRGKYYIKPIFLKSNVTLELIKGCILYGSREINDYNTAFPDAGAIETSALIYAADAENISITGSGIIDGRGDFCVWGNSVGGRPKLVHFVRCKNIQIENVQLKNSAFWTVHLLLCDGVKIKGVNLYSHTNWNNDGLDIDSRNVEIEDCIIDCDDDGICMKSDRGLPSENVTVKNCTIRTNCSAIKLGTAGYAGFKNITYQDCIIEKASEDNFRHHYENPKLSYMGITQPGPSVICGIALESVDGGVLDGVHISNIKMKDVHSAIFLRLGDRHKNQKGEMSILRNVEITDITAECISKLANSIVGIPGGIIENVTIKNVEITLPGGGTQADANKKVPENANKYPENNMFDQVLPAYGFYVRHAKDITFENVNFTLKAEEGRPEYVFDDVEGHEVITGIDSEITNPVFQIVQDGANLYISSDMEGEVTAKVIDMTGALVSSVTQIACTESPIRMVTPQNGMYIVTVQSKEQIASQKVVIASY